MLWYSPNDKFDFPKNVLYAEMLHEDHISSASPNYFSDEHSLYSLNIILNLFLADTC